MTILAFITCDHLGCEATERLEFSLSFTGMDGPDHGPLDHLWIDDLAQEPKGWVVRAGLHFCPAHNK